MYKNDVSVTTWELCSLPVAPIPKRLTSPSWPELRSTGPAGLRLSSSKLGSRLSPSLPSSPGDKVDTPPNVPRPPPGPGRTRSSRPGWNTEHTNSLLMWQWHYFSFEVTRESLWPGWNCRHGKLFTQRPGWNKRILRKIQCVLIKSPVTCIQDQRVRTYLTSTPRSNKTSSLPLNSKPNSCPVSHGKWL